MTVADEHAGRKGRCSGCGAVIDVPAKPLIPQVIQIDETVAAGPFKQTSVGAASSFRKTGGIDDEPDQRSRPVVSSDWTIIRTFAWLWFIGGLLAMGAGLIGGAVLLMPGFCAASVGLIALAASTPKYEPE